MITRTAAVLVVAAMMLLSACDGGGNEAEKPMLPASELRIIKDVPEFSGVNFDGRTIANSDLRGKVWFAYFFFTSCGGPCPKMSSLASVLNTQFAGESDFRIVSFTVDPRNDTRQVLAKYAVRYGATPEKWHFLRMSADSVANVATRGFMQAASPDDPSLHGTKFMLVDREGRIRGFFGQEEEEVNKLRAAINTLLRANDE